jgi:chromosome segregation ATPase
MKLMKVVKLAAVGLIAVYVVNETKAGSHFKAWVCRIGDKLEKKVKSDDRELARIKHEIGQIDEDVDKVKGDLAEANVNVRLLHREIDDLRAQVKENETAVRKHGDVVKVAAESDRIQWGYRTVGHTEAKELLMAEVKRHTDIKARLKARETALAMQEQTRDLIEQQLQEMLAQKEELTAAVAEMEAELKLAQVEQIRSKYQNDGSRMADIKSSLAELRKSVLVQREKLQIARTFDRSPAEGKSVDEILAGIDGNTVKKLPDEVKIVTKP